MKKLSFALLILILGSCGVEKVPHELLFNHQESLNPLRQKQVITNQNDLDRVYAILNRVRTPGLSTPKVDFSNHVVLVFPVNATQDQKEASIQKVYKKKNEARILLDTQTAVQNLKVNDQPKFHFYILKVKGRFKDFKIETN